VAEEKLEKKVEREAENKIGPKVEEVAKN